MAVHRLKMSLQVRILQIKAKLPFNRHFSADIRNAPLEENTLILENSNFKGFRHHLITKYYETDLLLVPIPSPLDSCPQNLLSSAEGVLICFDAKKVNIYP